MKRILVLLALGLAAVASLGYVSPSQLFKRNAELKAEGYFMAEFEFKMMAALYYLNDGSYWKAYRTLRRIKRELESREGLVKAPKNANPDERIAFLLARQYPANGAFMDPDYPLFTTIGPTSNVLGELSRLSTTTGRPIRVRHPLRFLDQIKTPSQLRAFMSSLLYFKERWAERFGGPSPYVVATDLTGETIGHIETIGGYPLSPEWKDALSRWYYETQDPVTGFWGARIGDKDHWRQAHDIDSTSHILKHFLTDEGQARDAKYPLRYAETLADNLLKDVDGPIPEGAPAQHEWSLRQAHAAKIIVRLLWPSLSPALRARALAAMPRWLETRFAMYRPEAGGFAVASTSPNADVDATSTALMFLTDTGYVPGTWRRERTRGPALATAPKLVRTTLARWDEACLPADLDVNSVRGYSELPEPESWDDSHLVRIVYPHETPILDVMHLRQGLARYVGATGGEFGNWSSKESLKDGPLALKQPVNPVMATTGPLALQEIAGANPRAKRFFVVGLDRFQVPVFRYEFARAEQP